MLAGSGRAREPERSTDLASCSPDLAEPPPLSASSRRWRRFVSEPPLGSLSSLPGGTGHNEAWAGGDDLQPVNSSMASSSPFFLGNFLDHTNRSLSPRTTVQPLFHLPPARSLQTFSELRGTILYICTWPYEVIQSLHLHKNLISYQRHQKTKRTRVLRTARRNTPRKKKKWASSICSS